MVPLFHKDNFSTEGKWRITVFGATCRTGVAVVRTVDAVASADERSIKEVTALHLGTLPHFPVRGC